MTRVMGVVNVTPDSFVAELRTPELDAAVERCGQLVDEGAAILDIGGESTRPGADTVPLDEELARVVPVVAAAAAQFPNVVISVDTRAEEVARQAIAAGATLLNDMSSSLHQVAGELGVAYVAAHMQGEPKTMQDAPSYIDVVDEVLNKVVAGAEAAAAAGSPEVWIDPGIGFGKTDPHNLALLAGIDRFVASDVPVLVGVSRKGMTGRLHAASDAGVALADASAPTPTADRLEASVALGYWCALMGVDIIRVHDVAPTVQGMKVVEARTTV